MNQNQREDLLEIIDRVQSNYIRHCDPRELFDALLTDLLHFTESEYGFIGEILHTIDGEPYLKTHALTNIAWNKETREFYENNAPQGLEFYNLNSLFGYTISSGKAIIANSPATHPNSGGLPEGHPALNAYLGLPVYMGETFVGMIGMANKKNGYDESITTILKPLLKTYGQVIAAYRSENERRTAVETLKANEAYLGAIFDGSSDAILHVDSQFNIITANSGAQKLFAYSSEELTKLNLKSLIATENNLNDFPENDKTIELQVKSSSGKEITTEARVNNLEIDNKNSYVLILRDITERIKVDKMKNEFISTISHELRTPLTSIHGTLKMLDSNLLGELPEKAKELVSIATRNSIRLNEMINDLLDMEKLISSTLEISQEPVDLSKLALEAIENNRSYASKFNITLAPKVNFTPLDIMGSNVYILRVLDNLISNAIKFSNSGHHVDINIMQQDHMARIEVIDYGAGISEEFQPYIFNKFSQEDSSSTRKNSGSGLGLSITRELVDKMGGNLGFKSKEGEGSLFYVEFPLIQ